MRGITEKISIRLKSIRGIGLMLALLALAASGIQAQTAAIVNDGHGKEWKQLTGTVGLTWNQVAQACPQDGVGRCNNSIAGGSFADWTWATDTQVLELMSYYEPAIVGTRGVGGMAQFFTAEVFLSPPNFQPTFSFCGTYQCGASASGWTATKDANGHPQVGSVSHGNTNVSIDGSFGVGGVTNPDEVGFGRGVWLWRDPNGIFATDDSGQVASPDGGTAVANVLANDRIGGLPANFATVTITQESSTHTGVNLNTANGAVNVSAGTPAGTYTLVYKMCSTANVLSCDTANVRVVVNPYTIDAVEDFGRVISPSAGGNSVPNVLANDRFSGGPATLANVSLSLVAISPNNGGVTLDLTDGSVDVAVGAPVGDYAATYRICALAQPTLCDQATALVTVQHYPIDAVNDYVRASSKVASTPLNVLANDTFNGARATTPQVTLTQVSPAIRGITLNTTTGWISVAAKTSSGIYYLTYKICETAAPTNCDTATATIELSGRG